MSDTDNTPSSQIGGINLSELENTQFSTQSINSSVQAGGHIAGRDIIIYNLYYTVAEAASPPPDTTADPLPENPYRGLFAFRPKHAHLFFGRDAFVDRLVAAVQSRRLVTVLGASGSGKSSVVFAGLAPALANQSAEPWLFSTFRPGNDPFLGLAQALVPLLDPDLSPIKQVDEARDLSDRLWDGKTPVTDYLAYIQRTHPDHRLLLIVDQFEETYTLCKDAVVQQRFLDVLLSALKVPHLPLTVVLTMRADFFGQAMLYRPVSDVLQNTIELLGPMTTEELAEVIEKPANAQGVTFADDLVDTLLKDMATHREGSLPLLEFALHELWQHQHRQLLTHEAYGNIGRVEGALSSYADRVYKELPEAEQEQARWIFARLVTLGKGTEDTRRLSTRLELNEHWALVTRLADKRLLVTNRQVVTDEDGQQDTVEVVHEALIRHWPRFREWLNVDRAFITWYEDFKFDLDRWTKSGRDKEYLLKGAALAVALEKRKEYDVVLSDHEKRQERTLFLNGEEREFIEAGEARQKQHEHNRRLLFVGAIAVAALMTVLAIFSFWQFQAAQRSARIAQAELDFSQVISPTVRMTNLATLFELKGIEARRLFWEMNQSEQLSLFNSDDPQVTAIIKGVMPSLADVNRSGYTDDLLPAMAKNLARLPRSAENDNLQAELSRWANARALTAQEQYNDALVEYRQLDNRNPAVCYERAYVLTRLGQPAEALAELDGLVQLAQDPTVAVGGVLAVKTDFTTATEMTRAARRLIALYPELGQALNQNAAAYPHLQQTGLVLTPTPTPVTDRHDTPMVLIPAGPFTMGSNTGNADERPVHTVYLDAFYMDQYETTNHQYAQCVADGACTLPGSSTSQQQTEAVIAYHQNPKNAVLPVIGVNWQQAQDYCAWRQARLPTEAEWEKAARGADERTYPWGELITCRLANYGECDTTLPSPPGSYSNNISPYGVYDLGGNMYEWIADWYAADYYGNSPAENPAGPAEGSYRVLRGGSWGFSGINTRASDRNSNNPGSQSASLGVRCAR